MKNNQNGKNGKNGKGDKWRKTNYKKYWDNFTYMKEQAWLNIIRSNSLISKEEKLKHLFKSI